MQPSLPVFSLFQLIGIQSCIELYTIFGKKPRHAFNFRISGGLQECLVDKLGDFRRTSSAMKAALTHNCTLKRMQKAVLSRLNKLLKEAD